MKRRTERKKKKGYRHRKRDIGWEGRKIGRKVKGGKMKGNGKGSWDKRETWTEEKKEIGKTKTAKEKGNE